jgi:hypothetical protein
VPLSASGEAISSRLRKELKIEDFGLKIEDFENAFANAVFLWSIGVGQSQIFNPQSKIFFIRGPSKISNPQSPILYSLEQKAAGCSPAAFLF